MNQNRITTDAFSSPQSAERYRQLWADEPECQRKHENGEQCGGCSFYAKFNFDWGLCCHGKSRHFRETVFEHFTCPAYVHEGWGPHSFCEDANFHCHCEGEPPT